MEYIAEHPITEGIDEFDYNGCSLNYTNNATALAWTEFRWRDSEDNITTDHIMPAGSRVLPFRSNLPKISEFVFDQVAISDRYIVFKHS